MKAKTLTEIYTIVGQVYVDTAIYILKSFRSYPINYKSSLIDSLDFDLTFQERDVKTGRFKEIKLILLANDYAQYLDQGRRPFSRKVPISALIKFIKKRGLQQKFRSATGRYKSVNAIAFIIQASIYRKGIQARNFIFPALEAAEKELQVFLDTSLLDILTEDLIEFYNTK